MNETYKNHRISIERSTLPQFASGPLKGGAAQSWKVTVDGRDVTRHVVRRKMASEDAVLSAARQYVDRSQPRSTG